MQAQIAGGGELDLIVHVCDLEDDVNRASFGDTLERRGDRRHHAGVADHQIRRRIGIGRVCAAGALKLEAIPGRGLLCPRTRNALIAVHDEIDGQPAAGTDPTLARSKSGCAATLPRTGGADLFLVERRRVIRVRWRELKLDVVVGELAGGEPLKPFAAELDPHHPRRQLVDVDDLDHTGCTAVLGTRALLVGTVLIFDQGTLNTQTAAGPLPASAVMRARGGRARARVGGLEATGEQVSGRCGGARSWFR